MSIPAKITPACSNIFLIDENLCVGNSLNIINSNVTTLTSALLSLENYQSNWNNTYTNFQTYSSVWLQTVTNVHNFSAVWVKFSTTIQNLSADWNKPYTIFYPVILETNIWYSQNATNQQNYIINWLNLNFPPASYNNNQIINVMIYIYEVTPVTFNFYRQYYENCTPNCPGITVSCGPGSCPSLYSGCNHHGGRAGYGGCDNLYGYCSQQASVVAPQSVSCTGSGGRTLSVNLNNYSSDTHISKTITMQFKKSNGIWNYTQTL